MRLNAGVVAAFGMSLALWAVQGHAGDSLPGDIGGAFKLTNQHGDPRSEADPDSDAQLLFFGYVNCQEICSAALPAMADVSDILAERGLRVTPVLVTVDPERDRIDTMGGPLADLHPGFVGLTGTAEALQVAYDAYDVSFEEVFTDPEFGPVYSHGSFIYLLDPGGRVLTLLPPVLSPEHMATIVAANVAGAG
ncbi:SCO family protein [Ovoidimarina sediminis]|uniref:SCO family protein n=1 Tax=Ovoidimarina sediminis TaxID=3079856 RepID=UPI00290A2508|nr:SCO family protein [Rhodophyticola sp. MJ-SS7]MDU8943770.1 SCO family protein [Rhodophyticola sp. MJ-SS7]